MIQFQTFAFVALSGRYVIDNVTLRYVSRCSLTYQSWPKVVGRLIKTSIFVSERPLLFVVHATVVRRPPCHCCSSSRKNFNARRPSLWGMHVYSDLTSMV